MLTKTQRVVYPTCIVRLYSYLDRKVPIPSSTRPPCASCELPRGKNTEEGVHAPEQRDAVLVHRRRRHIWAFVVSTATTAAAVVAERKVDGPRLEQDIPRSRVNGQPGRVGGEIGEHLGCGQLGNAQQDL